MLTQTFSNPILSGFYPDPSICRVEEDYYLVTSSFVYYPGLPIFHSKDLIHWEQIGHGIHRPDQLDYKNCETSLGLWAPSIRYHNNIFYIINTFVSEGREARRDNYIITASNPSGPWSDPIFIKGADGIDSSLFFDEDGRIWYAGNYIAKEALYEGHHGIYLNELDPLTFQFIGDRHIIWNGDTSHSKWIEAPHIYKKDGYYYLIVAEGGTFTNHSIMMARSNTITGDYEICPRNPIMTHRHLPLLRDISVTGHADIVQTQQGEWWMVLLAVRPYEGNHYNLGRETFMVPVVWADDGWLMVDTADGLVHLEERLPDLPDYPMLLPSPNDHFEAPTLHMMWNTIHPPVQQLYSLADRYSHLRLFLQPEVIHEVCTPSFIGRRQQHTVFQVKTVLEFTPANDFEEAGIVLLQDDRFHYRFVKTNHNGIPVLQLFQTEHAIPKLIQELPLDTQNRIYLTVQGNTTTYDFYYGYQEQECLLLEKGLAASLLSSTVNEGFTGTYIGMYASSNKQTSSNYADFDWFTYFGR